MKTIKLSIILLLLLTSSKIFAQDNSGIVIIRWSAVDKSRVNSGDAYYYIIDENSEIKSFDMQKERFEEGKSAVFMHRKLSEYLAKGYKLISSNMTATSMGYCVKGEYILQKE